MKLKKIDVGWIKFHRKIRGWKYYNKLKYEKVWTMMMMEANFDKQEYEGFIIDRGELVYSRNTYLEKLKDCDPKITSSNLRTIVNNLIQDGQISKRFVKSKNLTIIKIENYEEHQKKEDKSEEIEKLREMINVRDEIISRLTSQKQGENEKNINQPAQHKVTNRKPEINQPVTENQPTLGDAFSQSYWGNSDDEKTESTNLNQESHQPIDKNQPSCITETNPTKRIDKEIIKENFKQHNNTSKGLPKKYSQKFLRLTQEVISFMNTYLEKASMKKYDAMDREEVLRHLHFRYKNGSKDVVEYKKIIDYMFNYWNGQVNAQGKPMLAFFTPQTLFRTHFKKYIRWAENNATMAQFGPSQDTPIESIESKTTRIIKEADDKEKRERVEREKEEERKRKEEEDQYFKELELNFKEEQDLRDKGKIIGFEF